MHVQQAEVSACAGLNAATGTKAGCCMACANKGIHHACSAQCNHLAHYSSPTQLQPAPEDHAYPRPRRNIADLLPTQPTAPCFTVPSAFASPGFALPGFTAAGPAGPETSAANLLSKPKASRKTQRHQASKPHLLAVCRLGPWRSLGAQHGLQAEGGQVRGCSSQSPQDGGGEGQQGLQRGVVACKYRRGQWGRQ
eukprot:515014-Pelagomonas_calceolata.AAC.9